MRKACGKVGGIGTNCCPVKHLVERSGRFGARIAEDYIIATAAIYVVIATFAVNRIVFGTGQNGIVPGACSDDIGVGAYAFAFDIGKAVVDQLASICPLDYLIRNGMARRSADASG